MQQQGVALSRAGSLQTMLLHVIRSERSLQRQLAQQRALLRLLGDATAQLTEVWRRKAEEEEEGGTVCDDAAKGSHGRGTTVPSCTTGLASYYSLHELLLTAASLADEHTTAAATATPTKDCRQRVAVGKQARLAHVMELRLTDSLGLAPAHPILFGSLDMRSQMLLLPELQKHVRRLAERLPALCAEAALPPPVNGASRAHRKHPRSTEEDAIEGAADGTTHGEPRGRQEPGEGASTERPAVLVTLAPGLRLRLACEALRRLLTYLQLLLGLTDAEVAARITGGPHNPPSHGDPCHSQQMDFSECMQRWLDAAEAGVLTSPPHQQLPLVCLLRLAPHLRGGLRFLLVDLEEMADVLGEALMYRHQQQRQHGQRLSHDALTAWLPPALAYLSATPGAAAAVSSSGASRTDGSTPTVSELSSVAAMAELMAATVRDCLQLSEAARKV